MYLSIIVLPLLGSIVSGFFGRKVGVRGAQLITCCNVIVTTILAMLAFFEVGFNNIPVSIELFRWIDSEWINIIWGFEFDSLTVTMLLPVLIISSLVHIYSISYMSNDPHVQRFFSYLSLFTFMMIILVTGNNYLLMFVGWEGYLKCLIWLCLYISLIVYIYVNFWPKNKINSKTVNCFSSVSSFHNCEDISLIIGSLLGNSYMSKSSSGIIITFIKCSDNIEYLMWFHLRMVCSGYCSSKKPRLNKIISKNNKLLYTYKINSYNLSGFYWLYEMFYVSLLGAIKPKKVIPRNLEKFLTPLSLATWYLGGTDKLPKLHESSFIFKKEDLVFISDILKIKYSLDIITQLKDYGKVVFYIQNSSIEKFTDIVKPYILPSLHYKLKGQHNKLTLWSYNHTNSRSLKYRFKIITL